MTTAGTGQAAQLGCTRELIVRKEPGAARSLHSQLNRASKLTVRCFAFSFKDFLENYLFF